MMLAIGVEIKPRVPAIPRGDLGLALRFRAPPVLAESRPAFSHHLHHGFAGLVTEPLKILDQVVEVFQVLLDCFGVQVRYPSRPQECGRGRSRVFPKTRCRTAANSTAASAAHACEAATTKPVRARTNQRARATQRGRRIAPASRPR